MNVTPITDLYMTKNSVMTAVLMFLFIYRSEISGK